MLLTLFSWCLLFPMMVMIALWINNASVRIPEIIKSFVMSKKVCSGAIMKLEFDYFAWNKNEENNCSEKL